MKLFTSINDLLKSQNILLSAEQCWQTIETLQQIVTIQQLIGYFFTSGPPKLLNKGQESQNG